MMPVASLSYLRAKVILSASALHSAKLHHLQDVNPTALSTSIKGGKGQGLGSRGGGEKRCLVKGWNELAVCDMCDYTQRAVYTQTKSWDAPPTPPLPTVTSPLPPLSSLHGSGIIGLPWLTLSFPTSPPVLCKKHRGSSCLKTSKSLDSKTRMCFHG